MHTKLEEVIKDMEEDICQDNIISFENNNISHCEGYANKIQGRSNRYIADVCLVIFIDKINVTRIKLSEKECLFDQCQTLC